ncbi:unnamed protein product [Soboliphyme baturini]|uniref:Sep15_SelM domain-containing protein n=1 Tax=Soboliphyme baturini TaxID=241478 RepID=A0A183IQT6_9BILA|nr:unnamed protein product [Soboliphyme baturini]
MQPFPILFFALCSSFVLFQAETRPNTGKREPIVKKNELFEKFYRAQNIVPDNQWEDFLSALRRDLPHTFRLVGCKRTAAELLHILKKDYFPSLQDVYVDEENVQPPSEISWYPNGFGLKMKLSRQVIRKHEGLKRLHQFLVSETELVSSDNFGLID